MLKMPKRIVINTGPLIAIIAGLGNLKVLEKLYKEVMVPYEVGKEMLAKKNITNDAKIFDENSWLNKLNRPVKLNSFLSNSLDKGEASVIQLAIDNGIKTVCIDEAAGRRIARLNDLKVTGSLGVIISAIKIGEDLAIESVIRNMRENGVWISNKLAEEAIRLVKTKY